jgi:hypothetical protein
MAFENESEQQQQQQGEGADQSAGNGAEDLNGVLGAADATFVTGEKKPFSSGTLIMAGFLLACGAGTYVMYTRSAPANTPPSAEAAAAQTTISQFLSDDQGNVSKMKDLLHNTEKAVEQFRTMPGKAQVPVEALQTNPFRIADVDPEAVVDSDALTTAKRQQEERVATTKAAQALQLQFVMGGKRRSCMINNTVYGEGQMVGAFTIESISSTSVVIRKGDARFELRMKK